MALKGPSPPNYSMILWNPQEPGLGMARICSCCQLWTGELSLEMTQRHQGVAETSQSHWDHSLHWDSQLQQEHVPFLEQAGNSVGCSQLSQGLSLVLGFVITVEKQLFVVVLVVRGFFALFCFPWSSLFHCRKSRRNEKTPGPVCSPTKTLSGSEKCFGPQDLL